MSISTQNVFNFPLTKILIGFIICLSAIYLGQYALNFILGYFTVSSEIKNLLIGIVSAGLGIYSYIFLYKIYEKRDIDELSTNQLVANLLLGIGVGATLQSLTILVMFLIGSYVVIAINGFQFLLPALTMAITSAIVEELMIRGIVFRILEEKLGSYIALIISALLFGVLHIFNPNATWITALGIAIQAGLLLGLAYMYSRSLWFPIAIHFAWNFTQSGIYGAATSGISSDKSLLRSQFQGSDLITGGSFGPEGSIQATLFCVCASIILLLLNQRNHKIIKPYWKNMQQAYTM